MKRIAVGCVSVLCQYKWFMGLFFVRTGMAEELLPEQIPPRLRFYIFDELSISGRGDIWAEREGGRGMKNAATG
jgi:hypothetical protein